MLTTFILLPQPPLPLLPTTRPPTRAVKPHNHTLLPPSTPQLCRDRGGTSSSNQEKRHLRGVTSSTLDLTRTPVRLVRVPFPEGPLFVVPRDCALSHTGVLSHLSRNPLLIYVDLVNHRMGGEVRAGNVLARSDRAEC